MRSKPLISVITVTFNSGKTIKRAVESVLSQTNKNWEYIIIDGGSKDETLTILKNYSSKISKIVSEPDEGIYDAMNKGLHIAEGMFIYYLNSDDFFYDRTVLNIVSATLEKNRSIDVLTADVLKQYLDFNIRKSTRLSTQNLKHGSMPPHQSMFVSKKILTEIGGFSTRFRYAGDFELCCRLVASNANVLYIPQIIAVFSSGGAGANKKVTYSEVYKILNGYFGQFWAFKYWLNKIFLEQGISNMLGVIGWQYGLKTGSRLSMTLSNRK